MGSSRADVVMILEDSICGIEIKSDADTYARLSGQVKDYDKYYDYNIVVVGSSHALHIREHVPEYWGIISAESGAAEEAPSFVILRQPRRNPRVTWKKKLEILWRTELAQLQEMHNMPKYKEKSKSFVIGKLIELTDKGSLEEAKLRREVSELLFERDYTTIAGELAEYRRGEIEKALEREKDPAVQLELITKRIIAKSNLKKRPRRRRGR